MWTNTHTGRERNGRRDKQADRQDFAFRNFMNALKKKGQKLIPMKSRISGNARVSPVK
jgi:hypothetical protein